LKKNISNSSTSLFPCKLDEAFEKKLSLLSDELLKNWGERQLSVLELDDRIATAAEKAPTDDNLIKLLRESLSDVKKEYEKVLIHEEEKVREAGGLHVFGTERHESRRVDNQLRGRAGRQGDLWSTRFFLSLDDNLLSILKEIKIQTRKLALALKVKGLLNIQFAIKKDEIFVIEVNPRASRTVPFVSKANGIPLAKIASRVMAGEKLSRYKLKYKTNKRFAVKEAVFPFNKFPDSDLLLGPEMKSTGEVMGFDDDFGIAIAKSQIAASNSLPTKGMAFLSVKDSHKQEIIGIAQRLIKLGFTLSATSGTAEILIKNGMKCRKINKVSSGKPHIVDVLNSKKIALVINTGGGNSESRINDAVALRRGTLANKIKNNEVFLDDKKQFSRIKYEKFLLENNITAPDFEIRFRNEELKKKLFAYVGGGIKSPYFLNNKIYINKNKEVEVKYLDLDTVYNTETPETEIEQFIKDNEENLKEEVIDFSYAKITPSNLIDSDEFNNEFFKKIDEIENSILNDSSIEDIRKIYDLKIEYLSNYNNEDKNNEIFKEIYEKRNDEKIQLLDKNDYYLLFEVTKINKVLPSKSEIKFIERVKENLILKKKYEYNKDLFQKIQDKKFNNDEFVKISKNGENLLNETIKSLDDNSIFDKDSVSLIYSLPENSFVLLTNDNNKIFLAKVNKIYTKNLPKNDIENSEYLEISNNKIVEEIYSSYDLALSKKYKVKVFQNTLDRIKNNFK